MENEKTGPSFVRPSRRGGGPALAAWVLFKLVIGVVAAVAWFVVAIVAIVAILWAVRTLF